MQALTESELKLAHHKPIVGSQAAKVGSMRAKVGRLKANGRLLMTEQLSHRETKLAFVETKLAAHDPTVGSLVAKVGYSRTKVGS